MKHESHDTHEIASDGRTVWVNDATGCCIGRYCEGNIDVHHTGPDQVVYGRQCLACAHGDHSLAMWDDFLALMRDHHGIEVGEHHRPRGIPMAKGGSLHEP